MRGCLGTVATTLLLLAAACSFDPDGPSWQSGDAGVGDTPDGAASSDGAVSSDGAISSDATPTVDAIKMLDAEPLYDALALYDAVPPIDAVPPTCVADDCPLGCNTAEDRCARLDPTNFDVTAYYEVLTDAVVGSADEDIYVHTDTGEISSTDTTYRTASSPGLTVDGIYYDRVTQAGVATW